MIAIFEGIEELLRKASEFSECSRALVTLTSAVGVLVVLYYAFYLTFNLIQVLRLYVFSQYCCGTNFVKKYGNWAVISGATDGIGQAMAKELAERGMSIVVIGRSDEKLARTKAMLEQVPNAGQIETVKIDLSDPSTDNFGRIRAQIDPENRDIGLLVNNAGTFPDRFARFNRFSMDEIKGLVNLNVLAPLHLTRMIMPGMVERGKGMVVNVSSVLGSVPAPYYSVYGATKSFMSSFTRQLQMEYRSHPIDIILLKTGQVSTKLLKATSKMSDSSFMIPSPEDYAKSSINALSTGIKSYTGALMHAVTFFQMILVYRMNLLPTMIELFGRLNGKNFELSPVMKRKRVVVVQVSDQQDQPESAANDAVLDKSVRPDNLQSANTQ